MVMNPWRDYISQEIDHTKESDADFNLRKIHVMSHWVEQIHRFGALQQYSAERHDQAHTTNLMEGWNTSNHNLNYLPQVINFQRRILCLEIRELNLQGVAQRRENSTATCTILPPGAELAAPLSSQTDAKPEFMVPNNCRDGNHPDVMIKDFRALLDISQDATYRFTIFNGTREFIMHKNHYKTYISDKLLHAMELCTHPCSTVPVEGLESEPISQIC